MDEKYALVPWWIREKVLPHTGHDLVIARYGHPVVNVTIECMDCSEVVLEVWDQDEEANDGT